MDKSIEVLNDKLIQKQDALEQLEIKIHDLEVNLQTAKDEDKVKMETNLGKLKK